MKNLKPFNLKEALAGKAVMLRNGTKAYIRHHETEVDAYSRLTLLGITENGIIRAWRECGHIHPATEDSMDIIGMYPETRVINGFEVPAPETAELDEGTDYCIASPANECLWSGETWSDHRIGKMWLSRGLVFLNKEDAIATAKAMLGIDPYIQEDKIDE